MAVGTGRNAPRTRTGKKVEIVLEADELWSFVGSKKRVFWVWVALEAATRRVLAMVVGDRDEFTAFCLWMSSPAPVRESCVLCTDFFLAYQAALPREQHVPSGKGDGLTNHVERFWWTLRQRCSRLVRKSLSFSKCLDNHLGALWDHIRRYNQSLL